ncbi:SMP-30/gluconolactonase/LRE family protein [Nocardia wallacei]|uniref:SMP-30/gluconolactonase/LRE family protein n=1 Tax=Nocardia wallacei TaxID=480035 RepID=UPI002458AE43|nr:SMP-30/gluconolactonase/LRE family protein [Nocardia wallacei]
MTPKSDVYEAVVEIAELGEGPTWDGTAGRLLWVDILGCRIHSFDPLSGVDSQLPTEQHVGAAKPCLGGGLVTNLRDGIGLYDPANNFRWLRHNPVPGRRGNDAAVAPDGTLWAGTMRYDERPGGGTLSRIMPDGTAVLVLGDVTISNGIGWSPDGRRMYFVDTPTRRIDVFDYTAAGASGRRPWVTIEQGAGFPDGLTVDTDGAVWVALWDGASLRRYTPKGHLDRVVPLPVPRPTACAFGGNDLSDLYVTTARTGLTAPDSLAGSLLVLPDIGHGLPQPAFGI